MDARELFDSVAAHTSRLTTQAYSTSFSLGIRFLDRQYHDPIYGIYGFVRFADEIVDTFHEHDKRALLEAFKADTYKAIEQGISLNPILHSFQKAVREYNITRDLIDTFLHSMEMDLNPEQEYTPEKLKTYILGSAEVVGLMCLKVFVGGDQERYDALKPAAMYLGSAFQKVNFLRDLGDDFQELGRSYFPDIDLKNFGEEEKRSIETDIQYDFDQALEGIKQLPRGVRHGVYLAYVYYRTLFHKIQQASPSEVMKHRIRVPNGQKLGLALHSYYRHTFNLI